MPQHLDTYNIQEAANEVRQGAQSLIAECLADPRSEKPLNVRDRDFVTYYIKNNKSCAMAARKAGYSESVARSRAGKWVRPCTKTNPKLNIWRALYENRAKIHRIAVKSAAEQLTRQVVDSQYILEETQEHLLRAKGELPIKSIEIENADGEVEIIDKYEYDGKQVLKSIELLGKNKKVKAWDNSQEIETGGGLAMLLANITTQNGPPAIDGECSVVTDQAKLSSTSVAAPSSPPNDKPIIPSKPKLPPIA